MNNYICFFLSDEKSAEPRAIVARSWGKYCLQLLQMSSDQIDAGERHTSENEPSTNNDTDDLFEDEELEKVCLKLKSI